MTHRAAPLRSLVLTVAALWAAGCGGASERWEKPYGQEQGIRIDTSRRHVWAVAPAVNLSGQSAVDPILQADLVYQQLQSIKGLTVIPVDRVVQVMAGLNLGQVQSSEQASLICRMLGADALVVPTVTQYDPYTPPKMAASLALFRDGAASGAASSVDPAELARRASPTVGTPLEQSPQFVQAVGMFDAAVGSTRQAVLDYAQGRHDPSGPLGSKEYFVNMDRYSGFVYRKLIEDLLDQVFARSS